MKSEMTIRKVARQFVQLAVGLYMLVYLGLMSQENMQIEGDVYKRQIPRCL